MEVDLKKPKYMFMSQDQNAGRIHHIKIDISSFERAEEFKYLGTNIRNQNYEYIKKIKNRLKSGNVCYHSVQNFLSSGLLSKNIKLKIHRTIILHVFCMGVKLGRSH